MLLVYYYKTNSVNLIFGSSERIHISKKQKTFIEEINRKSEELSQISKTMMDTYQCANHKELLEKASKDKMIEEELSSFSNQYKKQVAEIIKLVSDFNVKYCEGYEKLAQSKNDNL
jgi:methyl-accepting chemotaxis protein